MNSYFFLPLLSSTFLFSLSGCHAPSKTVRPNGQAPRVSSEIPQPALETEPAVVNVMLTYLGIPVNYGTGVFVSSSGHLLTNAHVLGPAISGRMMKQPSVVTIDGEAFQSKDIQVLDCFGKKNHDLCLLKVDYQPKFYFDMGRAKNPANGVPLFHLSIPSGSKSVSYLGTAGGFVKLREDDGRFTTYKSGDDESTFIEHIRIAGQGATGESGGPVLTSDGQLAGIETLGNESVENAQRLAISAREVVDFTEEAMRVRAKPFKEYQAGVAREVARLFKKRYSTLQRQELNLVRAGFDLDEKEWSVAKLSIGGKPFQHLVTKDIPCQVESKDESTGFACRFRVDDYYGFIRIEILKRVQPDILKLDGTKPEAELTALARALKEQKLWDQVTAKIGARATETLSSHPSAYKCKPSAAAASPTLKDWRFCEQRTTNAPDLDSGRLTLILQDKRGWLARATIEADPEVSLPLAQAYAEIMLYSLKAAVKP